MSKIVISGYYGFANAGDEAMLTAIIKSLRSKDETVQLTVISGNPTVTAKKHNVVSIHRFNPWKIIAAVKDCDLLLSGGGSLLQDVTSKKSLLYYLSVLAIGKLLSKKVMLFAQGIGPIRDRLLRKLTKIVCSGADVITVRDADSLTELKRIGISDDKVVLTADSVLTLPQASVSQGAEIMKKFGVPDNKKIIAVSVRPWQQSDYIKEIAEAADVLAEKYNAHIVLLPLQYAVDIDVSESVRKNMKNKDAAAVISMSCDTEQFLSLIGNADLLIGMRLHALVFASVMEVPFVAVSYDPKIDGFVKEISGVSAGNVETLESKDIVTAAEQAFAAEADNWQKLKVLRQKALQNVSIAFALLEGQSKRRE